jgi:hypothetical protein
MRRAIFGVTTFVATSLAWAAVAFCAQIIGIVKKRQRCSGLGREN